MSDWTYVGPTDEQIRLECLRLAVEFNESRAESVKAHDADTLLGIAQKFRRWVAERSSSAHIEPSSSGGTETDG